MQRFCRKVSEERREEGDMEFLHIYCRKSVFINVVQPDMHADHHLTRIITKTTYGVY